MKCRPLSREEVRELDRQAIEEYGLPGIVLMENAGRGAAECLANLGATGKVLICCGKGNNAGDGFVMARHLDAWGLEVKALLFAPPAQLAGDAAVNFRVLDNAGIAWQCVDEPRLPELDRELGEAAWIVDALFGTGLSGPVREPLAGVIAAINRSGRAVLAVDLPSGLEANSGRPLGECIVARHTVTFVAPKLGFSAPEAQARTGTVHVVEIGLPRRLLQPYAAAGGAP